MHLGVIGRKGRPALAIRAKAHVAQVQNRTQHLEKFRALLIFDPNGLERSHGVLEGGGRAMRNVHVGALHRFLQVSALVHLLYKKHCIEYA